MIIDIQTSELDRKFLADATIGVISELFGLFSLICVMMWDSVANAFYLRHNETFGTWQIYLLVVIALYMVGVGFWIKMTIKYWRYYGM